MTRKNQRRISSKKVWDQGCWCCKLIHLWCI